MIVRGGSVDIELSSGSSVRGPLEPFLVEDGRSLNSGGQKYLIRLNCSAFEGDAFQALLDETYHLVYLNIDHRVATTSFHPISS